MQIPTQGRPVTAGRLLAVEGFEIGFDAFVGRVDATHDADHDSDGEPSATETHTEFTGLSLYQPTDVGVYAFGRNRRRCDTADCWSTGWTDGRRGAFRSPEPVLSRRLSESGRSPAVVAKRVPAVRLW